MNPFLLSALCKEGFVLSTEAFLKWILERRDAIRVEVDKIPFKDLQQWGFDEQTGNLKHASGKFFSIEGISVNTNWGNVSHWTQPIINQPEIGFLGIITKKFNGVFHFLMQAKIEPGNINFVQLSPTLQATKSNYSKVHKGKSPLYLEYFNGINKVTVLLDQLQSEQGARFLKKRNRNIIVEVQEELEVHEDFCWLTLGQIKQLMRFDNLINMDTRTVLSGISYGSDHYPDMEKLIAEAALFKGTLDDQDRYFLTSALEASNVLNPLDQIISWITSLKSTYELEVERIPLNKVQHWHRTETEIHHDQYKYFKVIAANVHISNREVTSWSQPLVESAQEGLIAFIIKKINGIYHFLVQAKIEAGNFDILELAPTVQCLTGNYRKGLNEYEVPFINEVLNASDDKVLYKTMQSEEGGRFYKEQNLNMIIEVGPEEITEIPENFCWITLHQLHTFIKYNNYLNIQARSLLAAITF